MPTPGLLSTPRDLVHAALASFDEGGSLMRDGGGDSGPPLFDSTDQGWTLEVVCDFADPAAARGEHVTYRYYVDHVGLGRREALPMYLEALRGAGLDAAIDVVGGGSSRRVVWLAGTYDGEGRRME